MSVSTTPAFRTSRIHQRHDLTEWIADFQGCRPNRIRVASSGVITIGNELMTEHRQSVFLDWLKREAPDVFGLCDGLAPTPDEIHERCQEIQREWSPQERRARELGETACAKGGERTITRREPWQPPMVACHAED